MCVPAPRQKVVHNKNSQNSAGSLGVPATSSSVNPPHVPAAEYDRLVSPVLPQCQPAFDHLLQRRDFNAQNGTNIVENDAHRSPLHDDVVGLHKLNSFFVTRWGWVVTTAIFMTYFNIVGWVGCFSVVFVSLQDEFGRSATETACSSWDQLYQSSPQEETHGRVGFLNFVHNGCHGNWSETIHQSGSCRQSGWC